MVFNDDISRDDFRQERRETDKERSWQYGRCGCAAYSRSEQHQRRRREGNEYENCD
jgi:hypothetical protein